MGIHKSEKSVEACLRSILQSNIDQKDKELIKKFHEECYSQGLSHTRVVFYLDKLKQLVLRHYPQKPIHLWEKQDVKEVVGKIEKSNYSEWSKMGYKLTIKKFINWLEGFEWTDKNKNSDKVDWIKLIIKKKDKPMLNPQDILTEEEVGKLIEFSTHPRTRALVFTLYELGVRISEVGNLRVKDLTKTEHGYLVNLKGKRS